MRQALVEASETETDEGTAGAGTGMGGFGYKAGIGTASRRVGTPQGQFTVGTLVVTNTGSSG